MSKISSVLRWIVSWPCVPNRTKSVPLLYDEEGTRKFSCCRYFLFSPSEPDIVQSCFFFFFSVRYVLTL
jgi:hypothetical protein